MREIPHTAERGENTRTDPDYAPEVEVFDNLTHREIHDGVRQLDPAAISGGQQAWQGSATGLADAVAQAHTEIRSLIADGWRGGAAATATEAVLAFERDGQRLAEVMATVSQRLVQAGDAAESLRAAVGAPSDSQPDLSAALLDPSQATANSAAQKSAEHDRQDAVAAMNSIYSDAFIGSGSGVPAFPDVTQGASVPATAPVVAAVASPVAGVDTEVPVAHTVPVAAPVGFAASESSVPAPQPAQTVSGTTSTPAAVPATGVPSFAAPVAADAVPVAQADRTATVAAATTAPAAPAAPVPDRAVSPAAAAPVTAASAAPVVAPTVPGGGSRDTGEDDRKRDERKRDSHTDSVSGAGAGAFGGLMGGALAAGDTTRAASGIGGAPPASRPARDEDDEDDDLHWFDDDDLTFLEPADEPGELIGALDPTTPPVVGEWTDLE